jgi:hypothetical protein
MTRPGRASQYLVLTCVIPPRIPVKQNIKYKNFTNSFKTLIHTFLKHEQHVDVCQKIQNDLGEFQGCIPRESRDGEVPRGIQFVVLKTHPSEPLKDVGKQDNIDLEIEVTVFTESLDVKLSPNILGVLVVPVADVTLVEFVVKLFLIRQRRLFLHRVHVIIAKDAFTCDQLHLVCREVPAGMHEVLWSQETHERIKAV